MKLHFQIHDLLKQGEHELLDFKKRVDDPVKIAKTLVAFANTKGGTLLIGVDDDGEIIGVDANEEKYIINKAAKEFCFPVVKVKYKLLNADGTDVLSVEVEKSATLHCAVDENKKRIPYLRVGDKTVVAKEILKKMEEERSNHSPIPILSERTQSLLGYLENHDSIRVEEYAKEFSVSEEVALRSLEALVIDQVLKKYSESGLIHYSVERN